MKRFLKVTFVVVLAAMIAVPAFAEQSATGFFRVKAQVQTFPFGAGTLSRTSDLAKDAHSQPFVEQRIRVKNTYSNNEFAKVVFYIESDQTWGLGCTGVSANVCRNGGGNIGADRVNIELKNLYGWFKIPDTNYTFKAGVQGLKDPYKFIWILNDVSALVFNTKVNDAAVRLAWIKGEENDRQKADDLDGYLADVDFKVENFNVGLHLYYVNDDSSRASGSTTDIYTAGITGKTMFNDVSLDAFFVYQFGTVDSTVGSPDLDISAFAFNLGAKAKVGPGNAFFEGLYITGDDSNTDTDINNWTPFPGTNGPFYIAPQLQIISYNAVQHTNANALFGLDNNGNSGRGLILVSAGYGQKITDSVKGQIVVGYATDAEKGKSGNANMDKEGSAIEVTGKITTTITKGLTVGIVGAYASLSDFFVNPTDEADDLFLAYIPLTFKF